ncbi:MAG: hypothetical protein DLM59_12810 [Pseudonocardiales bacterium]|nr:MAG: hypothetical protein DLM59_12810 [Pseudonocardiales bacterium]
MIARRAALLVAGLAATASLGGCGQDKPPTVSLSAGGQAVTAQATRWCPDGKKCVSHSPPAAVLKIPARGDLTVDVGATVAKRPWIILVDGGTASPLQRHSRTFRLVAVRPGVTVEVVTVDTDGARVLQRDSWVFNVR